MSRAKEGKLYQDYMKSPLWVTGCPKKLGTFFTCLVVVVPLVLVFTVAEHALLGSIQAETTAYQFCRC